MSTDLPPTSASPLPDAAAPLPDDPVILQHMIRELLDVLRQTRHENEQLQHRLDLLLRRLYGPRTERFDPNQPLLIPDAFDDPSATASQGAPPAAGPRPEEKAGTKEKQRGHGRKALPKDLPRVPVLYELTEAERRCPECGEPRVQIGAECSEQLDYKPASLFVVEHRRCTYACPHCQGHVTTAEKPAQPIPKGLPGPGLLAHVITEKYADHIPLYRQERRLARQGIEITRSTLCDWMGGAAKVLEPLYDLMKTLILLCGAIHTDDTSVKVRDSERKIKATARLWIYWGDFRYPFNVFDFTMSRSRDGPSRFLEGYRGFLQADAFGGYDGIYAGGRVIEVGCNAHARRKFVEAQNDGSVARRGGVGVLSRALCHREGDQEGDRRGRARGRGRRIGAGRDPTANPPGTGRAGPGAVRQVARGAEEGRAAQESDQRRDRLRPEPLGGADPLRELGIPGDRQQRV